MAETGEIHSSLAGELLTERGMSPLPYLRRLAVTKMLDETLKRGDSPRVTMSAVAFLTAIGRYRERVGVEIGNASENGARWWTCRLVQVCEQAGWVRLDK